MDTMPDHDSIPASNGAHLQCCCGRIDCAYLRHNNVALEGLEKDVQTAAQLGQALLVRHEAFMAEAEQERQIASKSIAQLESDKSELEATNMKTIEENRSLLTQLEELNNQVSEGDSTIKSLTATLHSTQQELSRLAVLAARTAQLEIQLASLEQEQMDLQSTLTLTKEDERSAVQRWRRAERTVNSLQDEVSRIESEARLERERHVEVLGRLERRRAVEKELESAAGRLKGAAAATSIQGGRNGSSVVSHFVKDILQDNANLQMGIVELREMLLVSNDEVQVLREQLQLHRPLDCRNEDGTPQDSLRKELGLDTPTPKAGSQELHVHHHYHASPETPSAKERPPLRRPRRKRTSVSPQHFNAPLSGFSTPRSVIAPTPPSTASAILSQTSVTVPANDSPTASDAPAKRWSMQTSSSSFAPSSVPSSPQSTHRTSSIFDRAGFIDTGMDSSRPTSPDSIVSPMFGPTHLDMKKEPANGWRSLSAPLTVPGKGSTSSIGPVLHPTLEEADEAYEEDVEGDLTDLDIAPSGETDRLSPPRSSDDMPGSPSPQPTLRRCASTLSISSVHGMDIHSPGPARLRHRPSQLMFHATSQPVSSLLSETAIARPSLPNREGWDSSSYTRSLLGLQETPIHNSSNETRPSEAPVRSGLSGRLGGWRFSPWGYIPTPAPTSTSKAVASLSDARRATVPGAGDESQPLARPLPVPSRNAGTASVADLRSVARQTTQATSLGTSASSVNSRAKKSEMFGRLSGVNQTGPIPFLRPARQLPKRVQVIREVDIEALREGLGVEE